MKLEIETECIKIIPENAQDVAYLHDTLGLKNDGDSISFVKRVRQSIIGMGIPFTEFLIEKQDEELADAGA